MTNAGKTTARVGAVFYILWSLLHIYAAYTVYQLGSAQKPGLVQGKLHQEAWNLAALSIFAAVIAVRCNWYNNRLGYWLNLITVSVTDMGFIIFVLIPGYSSDLLGPILWLLGLLFSTIGMQCGDSPGCYCHLWFFAVFNGRCRHPDPISNHQTHSTVTNLPLAGNFTLAARRRAV